jgi:hypothetical protein
MKYLAHLFHKPMGSPIELYILVLSMGCFLSGIFFNTEGYGRDSSFGAQWKYLWVQVDEKLHQCELKVLTPCAAQCPLECAIDGLGRGQWDESEGRIFWYPNGLGQSIGGVGVEGTMDWMLSKEYRPRVLSNGFQSWSYSGLMEIPPPQSLSDLKSYLSSESLRGEEFRDGRGPSWEFSALLDRQQHVFAGALTAERWSSWVRFGWSRPDLGILGEFPFISLLLPYQMSSIEVFLVSGMNGDEVHVSEAGPIVSERWFLKRGSLEQLSSTLSEYQRTLDRRRGVEVQEPLERSFSSELVSTGSGVKTKHIFGWNSWYHLWNKVTQKDVLYNLEILRPFFKFLTGEKLRAGGVSQKEKMDLSEMKDDSHQVYATIDDGWQVRWGEWRPNNKFPSSLAKMAQMVESQGYGAGLWLAPFLVDIRSPLITDHPDWFVVTDDFIHPSGVYKILDVTHPEVKEHLTDLFTEIRDASFRFVKLDFLYTATFPGQRYQPMTSIEAYREGLALIRSALGDGVEILACGAPHLPSRPYVDRWRIGPDIAYEFPVNAPVWVDIAIQARNIGARSFLCQRSSEGAELQRPFACDSDPWLVRGRRQGREIQSALWVSSLTGSGVILSDDFSRVPVERLHINLSRQAIGQALSGTPARADFTHWVSQKPSPRLYGTNLWERLWDTGGASMNAPVGWNLSDGSQLFINFTPHVFVADDGTKVYPRESFLEAKKP